MKVFLKMKRNKAGCFIKKRMRDLSVRDKYDSSIKKQKYKFPPIIKDKFEN